MTADDAEHGDPAGRLTETILERSIIMRGILLWLIGIPIPIIILLYLFNVF